MTDNQVDECPPVSIRPFFTVWSGQALSLLGSQLVQFAIIWWLTITTESATVLALASMVGLLPIVIIGPFCWGAGGWLAAANDSGRCQWRAFSSGRAS